MFIPRSLKSQRKSFNNTFHFRQNKEPNTGENLAQQLSSANTYKNPTGDWFKERDIYNFNKQGFSQATGHFTQGAWKNTKKLGIGMAQAADGWIYTVANYFPSGNVQGEFNRNVEPHKDNEMPLQ